MLADYLRWLCHGQRIEPGCETAEVMDGLSKLGAVVPAPLPTVVACPSCEQRVAALERAQDGTCSIVCADCGWQPVPLTQLQSWRACADWLPRAISEALNVQAIGAKEIETGGLWYLGRVTFNTQRVALWWTMPRAADDPFRFEELVRALTSNNACVLSASLWSDTTSTDLRVVLLADVAALSPSGLEIDAELLAAHARPASVVQAPGIEIAPDGAWLRVNGRELRLRGKQRDFALVMVEAYRQGNHRPRREWVLRRAGYGEAIDDLRQIATRPEFFEMFGSGEGEVWIKLLTRPV